MHHPLRTDALDYELPEHFIATRPAEPRDSARLMVLRNDGGIDHRLVRDLPDYLRSGDAMVFNTTAVLPARLAGRREDTGGGVQGLFLEERGGGRWLMMLRSSSKLRTGQRIVLEDRQGKPSAHRLELESRDGAQWTARLLGERSTEEALAEVGRMPLPPYILRARGASGEHREDDRDEAWYQTVYADAARRQSVAAPTAGLHFTPELLQKIESQGVERLDVVLHVGAGTFKPVSAEHVHEHEMHAERFEVDTQTLRRLQQIAASRQQGNGRIIAVGTTTVRTLESLPADWQERADQPIIGETQLLIAPPFDFRLVDGLLTNFHLPRSTLLALVGALVGLERLKAAYTDAVRLGYRFYSYGDAMFVEPKR